MPRKKTEWKKASKVGSGRHFHVLTPPPPSPIWKRLWLWKLYFILCMLALVSLLASNGMIRPEKRLYIKMNISEVMRTQQGNWKQFKWTSKKVPFLPFTIAKSKVECCRLLFPLFAFVTCSYFQLLKWSGLYNERWGGGGWAGKGGRRSETFSECRVINSFCNHLLVSVIICATVFEGK
jgi:hypothetical protein